MSRYDKTTDSRSRPRTQQKKHGGGTLLGIFIGLVLGVLIALGVTLYLNKATLPFQDKYEGAPTTGSKGSATADGSQAPLPLPGKPGDKPAGQNRFEFYGLLEGKQPAMPETAAPTKPAAAVTIAPPASESNPGSGEVIYVQLGAFQQAADADNLKAKLALSGLEANVQEVTIPEKGTMHRVRIGPYRSTEEMNRARTLLSQAGMQGTVIRQKE